MPNKELLNKKHFCIFPWTHMHTWPNGNVYMCCTADPYAPMGNLNDGSKLSELWNSDQMKRNRLKMLNDEYVPECARCYEIEASGGISLRQDFTKNLSHHLDMVDMTNPDGSVDKLNLPYVDFRFSNLCNLRCRTCGPELSSKWGIDHAKLMNKPRSEHRVNLMKQTTSVEIFWDEIKEVLPTLEMVYFAGGEPLIMEEHYRLLDLLLKNNMTHVKLLYNTNFTNLIFKGKHISEYWNKFDFVTVGASLDSWQTRAEYIRKDLKWNTIEENFATIKQQSPHVKIFVALTLSIFNFATLVEYHDYMVEKKFIDYDSLNINILTDPIWYKPSCLPLEFRQKIAEKYQKKLEYLRDNRLCGDIMLGRWQLAINYILSEYEPENFSSFVRLTNAMDNIRDEKFIETFPELQEFFL